MDNFCLKYSVSHTEWPEQCEMHRELTEFATSLLIIELSSAGVVNSRNVDEDSCGGGQDEAMGEVVLDDVDRGILFLLQEDARNTTIADIAERVEVSDSTVRNRIEHMEEAGVIEEYSPRIDYEKAQYPLHVLFVCSASAENREALARDALDRHGVVDVREMLTSRNTIHVEVVATGTRNLTEISNDLATIGFEIESSEILTNHYTRPWAEFEFNDGGE